MKKTLPLSLLIATVLTACGGMEKAPLKGKRIDISVGYQKLMADPMARQIEMDLPEAVVNVSWPQSGGVASHYIGHLDIARSVHKSWSKSIGGGGDDIRVLLNTPVVDGKTLYVMNTDQEVVAMHSKTGKRIWRKELELKEEEAGELSGGLALSDKGLFATTGSGEVFALNPKTGEIKWTVNLSVPLRAAPTVSDGLVFVVGHNNSLYALSSEDGALVWTHNGLEESIGIIGGAAVAVADGVVVVPYSSGEIYALRVKDGRYLWHDALSINVGGDAYSSLVDVEAMPVIADGIVYAVNHNGRLSTFDLHSGRRLWGVEISATQMPWVAGNSLFILSDQGQLVAMNRKDGAIRWVLDMKQALPKKEQDEKTYWSGPVLAGDRLIVVSNLGYAFSVNPTLGEIKKRVDMGKELGIAPVVANKRLYFMTENGKIISYR